jgi:hypothetical protein
MTDSKIPKLWHFYSKTLDGFYQSDVLVLADHKDAAVDEACKACEDWIRHQIEEYWYSGVMDYCDEEDDLEGSLREFLKKFRTDANENISAVPNNRIVMHKS